MIDKAKDIDNILYRELAPDRYCYIHNFIVEKDKEIERLNNIINELENYMIGKDIYKILLYKLRDLKESGNK